MKFNLITSSAVLGAAYAGAVLEDSEVCNFLRQSRVPQPDFMTTIEDFRNFDYYQIQCQDARTPGGYKGYSWCGQSAVKSEKYMQYKDLESYNPLICADHCEATSGCEAFNIYFERSPIMEPGEECPNPPAQTLVRCGLYNSALEASETSNDGQTLGPPDADGEAFQVMFEGSNIYNRIMRTASS